VDEAIAFVVAEEWSREQHLRENAAQRPPPDGAGTIADASSPAGDAFLNDVFGPAWQNRHGRPYRATARDRRYAALNRRSLTDAALRLLTADFLEWDLDAEHPYAILGRMLATDSEPPFAARMRRRYENILGHRVRWRVTDETAPEPRGHDRCRSQGLTLVAHLERVILRLTGLLAAEHNGGFATTVERICERLSALLPTARVDERAGDISARDEVVDELTTLDNELLNAVRATISSGDFDQLWREAEEELAAFRMTMAADALARARDAAIERLVRDRFGLPTLSYNGACRSSA
jgi:hypothetical protein